MKDEILSQIAAECPWRDTLYWHDTVDSTNTLAKQLAKQGAPHGTVLIAGAQSGGRGRLGRSFSSPEGMGVYLSVILRPQCPPNMLMHLTCATAVAVCRAIEQVCGILPDIKWTNDLVYNKKKLGGILTELSIGDGGLAEYAIVGIGINCNQKSDDFPKDLQAIATSVREITGSACSVAKSAAALVEALYDVDKLLLSGKQQLMAEYRRLCITPGQKISVVQGDVIRYGTAIDIDQNGGLLVRFSDGTMETVNSGEVSVRGMYGYL